MRKVILLVVPLLVTLLVGIAVLSFERARPPDWQVELGKYLQYKNSISARPMIIDTVVEASKPWNFSQKMSHTVYGDGVFHTDHGYIGKGGGNIDLPFPPERIRCVLLKAERNSAETPEVIFVGLHNDKVWWLDWVVHEGPDKPFSPEFSETMSLIGCELDLE